MNKLIEGKNELDRIVGLEVGDNGEAEIFREDQNGNVSSIFVPHVFWMLASEDVGGKFTRLEGDLHYQWGYQDTSRRDFNKIRYQLGSAFDTYNIYNAEEAMMVKDGYTFYKGMKPAELSLASIDIETTGLNEKAKDAFIVCISVTYRSIKGTIKQYFGHDEYNSQKELIEAFCAFIRKYDPSLIIGHNIIPFDLVYLNEIAIKVGTKLALGRDGSAVKFNKNESKFRVDGNRDQPYRNCRIYGREICDTLFLCQKWDFKKMLERYGLKPVIKQLGFEDPNRVFYEADKIRENYLIPEEMEQIEAYCKDDSDDAVKLWDYMGAAMFYWAQKVPKPFSEILLGASGSQLNALMCRAYLQEGHGLPKASDVKKYEGAICFAVPGIYDNCFKIDVRSMYPSCIIEYEVYDDEKDPKAYFLQIVKQLMDQRLEHKRLAQETGSKYYDDLQESEKIGINSAYGFLGAAGLNFNCPDAAAFITEKGREILLQAIKWASGQELKDIVPNYYESEDLEEETADEL